MKANVGPLQTAFRARCGAIGALALLLWAPGPDARALDELHFERIGRESGPPPEVITALHQDSTGFVWMATRDGLLRYDGYSFTRFEHDPSDPTSIADNDIRVVYEDRRGDLWIGTNTRGLEHLDRSTWTFEHYRHDSAMSETISHNSVYTLLDDSSGRLWVGTQQGLNVLDRETGKFRRIRADGTPGSLDNDYIMDVHEDRLGRIWVATLGGGLALFDPETSGFRIFRHAEDDPRSISHDRVTSLCEDRAGRLVVGTVDGLNVLEESGDAFRRFGMDPNGKAGLVNTLVATLAPDPGGTVWVGTYGGGLHEVDFSSGAFSAWQHRPDRRNSLTADRIMSVIPDQQGALWIGTWGGGVVRVRRSARTFARYAGEVPVPQDVASEDVTSLYGDREGGLWIGTRSGDVLRKPPGSREYKWYFRGGPGGVARIVAALAEDSSGRIWIGTSTGVLRLDPRTGDTLDIRHDPSDPTSLGAGYVRALLVDRAGSVWVGTGEGGLQKLDTDGRVVARYLHDPTDVTSISDDYVTALYEDREGTLWVGTRSAGLNAFAPKTERAVRYQPAPGDDTSLSHHFVASIAGDADGRLWVATGGGGLNRIDRTGSDVSFVRFTSDDGLIDDDVMAVVADTDGTLWVSTKRGLGRFDPGTGRFARYYISDGLPSAEFEPGAATRIGAVLFFGSLRWIVPVPAETPFAGQQASPTLITSMRTGNGEIAADQPAWQTERLEIPYGEWLSLEITTLDYMAEHNHAYAYRLGDEDDPWVALGDRRVVTFTDLDPGTYEFVARGRNSQGVWSNADPALEIRIVPPFWMTLWFRAAVLLGVVGLALVMHRIRLTALEGRNRDLVQLHEQREKARSELATAYQRLRVLARRLEVAKEDERKHIARELHDEMGPTLTAVIINLQLLSNNPDRAVIDRKLTDTIELVDRMVQRIRDISLDLRPPLLDELGLVPALRGYMESQSERAGIHIEVLAGPEVLGLPPEIEIAAFRVAQEAVTNVIRHAGATRADIEMELRNGDLHVAVQDDGSGFDVPRILDPSASTKAVGLLGLQERVEMLGGEFAVDSGTDRGTLVRVRLSLEHEA